MLPDRVALHDTTVHQLAAQLVELLRSAGGYEVHTDVACQLMHEFPTDLSRFDVAVCRANARWLTGEEGPGRLHPASAPVLAVNVVTAETLEEDWLRIPNSVLRTAIDEYVLFDPTGEVLRPPFQTVTKLDGELLRLWPAFHGVFFSSVGVRLDVSGTKLVASACGPSRVEEELYLLRWERDRLGPDGTGETAGLSARIDPLEARLRAPRTPRGGEET